MTPEHPTEPVARDAPIGGLTPPQFSIRTLLIAMGVLCLCFAIGRSLSPMGNAALILSVLIVLAHLAGAHFGHRLSVATNQARAAWSDGAQVSRRRVERDEFAQATRLGKRQSLGWPLIVCVVTGTLLGALGGWCLARFLYPKIAGVEHQTVSAIAFGILGAIIFLAIGGFVQESILGLVEAIRPPATMAGSTNLQPAKEADVPSRE